MNTEHLLWRLSKRGHVAEARARAEDDGPVLVFYVDRWMVWHARSRPAEGIALSELAKRTRFDLEAHGWQQ